jgi:hypothetical protein
MDPHWKYLTQNDQMKMREVIEYWMPHFARLHRRLFITTRAGKR